MTSKLPRKCHKFRTWCSATLLEHHKLDGFTTQQTADPANKTLQAYKVLDFETTIESVSIDIKSKSILDFNIGGLNLNIGTQLVT